ncbi:IPT/TIG domain-containing protein [Agriterribacter sp.]|uniref:IPT/TIG domain-containing protein n=1 Tax=Agriterribacter sp. TaxID=2821509 RepID=UPI002CFFC67B|nr:IPT/TIG domain-containing protein [Agriterribacter sp.]HTN08313.1 IPT/TIG domain-containing protein [Agriterribacter sp.]
MLIRNHKIISLFMLLTVLFYGCKKDGDKLPVNNAPIPRILTFIPENAAPGDLLTIKGLNFSADREKNIVRFNQTIVAAESVSDTAITVIIPELTAKTAGITVRSNGKISNKKNLNLVQIKVFADDFERDNVPLVGNSADPNPLGEHWKIGIGKFALENKKLATHAAGMQAYMFYRHPEADMKSGNGNFFKLSAEINVSAGSFGGIILNAQEDGKSFYLLRMSGTLMQFLKSGSGGPETDHWVSVLISGDFEGLAAGTTYKVELSSSTPGQIILKVTNVSTNGLVINRTIEDSNPYTGGVPGFYYFGLANPTDIYFDNMTLEIQ